MVGVVDTAGCGGTGVASVVRGGSVNLSRRSLGKEIERAAGSAAVGTGAASGARGGSANFSRRSLGNEVERTDGSTVFGADGAVLGPPSSSVGAADWPAGGGAPCPMVITAIGGLSLAARGTRGFCASAVLTLSSRGLSGFSLATVGGEGFSMGTAVDGSSAALVVMPEDGWAPDATVNAPACWGS